jgi:hypothetical protein
VCLCCAKRFKAAPPAGLEPGSPFGPNLRALALYLRFTQAISFERLKAASKPSVMRRVDLRSLPNSGAAASLAHRCSVAHVWVSFQGRKQRRALPAGEIISEWWIGTYRP